MKHKAVYFFIFANVAILSSAADSASELKSLFIKAQESCPVGKKYAELVSEIVSTHNSKAAKSLGLYGFKPKADGKAAYLFVEKREWLKLSDKLKIEASNASYSAVVCNPEEKNWPTLVIADKNTNSVIGMREGFEIMTGGIFAK